MRIKIISDGTSAATKIVDAETGEDVHFRGLIAVEWSVFASGDYATAKLHFVNVPVEVIGEQK